MWGFPLKRFVLLSVGVLALVGCSSSSSSVEPAPVSSPVGPVVTGPGEYVFDLGGAVGVVSLPGTADVDVAGAVAVAGVPAPVYVSVSVDNRNGASPVMPGAVNAYTVDGTKVTYQAAYQYLGALDDASLPVEDGNKIIAAFNKVNDPVSVGESRTVTMVGNQPVPADVVRVAVADAYGDEVQAAKQ